jgi:hypothetical protein
MMIWNPAWKERVRVSHHLLVNRREHTYSEDDQDNHKRAFRHRLGEEEQRGEADLLDIQAHKDMLERLGEEHTARVRRRRLLIGIQEKVFVELIKQEKGRARQAIDDRGNNRVPQS